MAARAKAKLATALIGAISTVSIAAHTGVPQAWGQSAEEAKSSDILKDGVYHITIWYYSAKSSDFLEHRATGIMARPPNQILTTTLFVEEMEGPVRIENIWRIRICEHELDRSAVASRIKEEDDKDKTDLGARVALLRKENIIKGDVKQDKAFVDRIVDRYKVNFDMARNCAQGSVKKIDQQRRVILLESSERLNGRAPTFSTFEPDVGAPIKAYGFPRDAEKFLPRRASEADRQRLRLVPSVTSGTVVKNSAGASEKEGHLIMHQAPIAEGAWGGPIVNSCDQVVGLNVRPQSTATVIQARTDEKATGPKSKEVSVRPVTVSTSNVMVATGAKELVTFAELNGITLNTAGSACSGLASPFDLKQNMWTLLIGGGALLLAAASMVVALRRPGPVRNTVARFFPGMTTPRNGSAAFEPGYGGGYGSAAPQQTSDYTPYAPTAAPHVETLQSSPPQSAHQPAPPRADPTRMMSEGGYTADSEVGARLVPIGGGPALTLDARRLGYDGLVFGREPDCDVVADNSTVSKRHARITRTQNGKLQIEDLGSANGTWRGRVRIQREAFGNGDAVRFGSLEYRIEIASRDGERAAPTLMMSPVKSWMLSGFDEDGRVVQWQLQPTVDGSGREVETSWIIGRNVERADKVLADKRVSGEHAKLRYTPQRGLEICDLGSSNGTKVDGRQITDSYVSIDDARVIELGGSKMSLSKA